MHFLEHLANECGWPMIENFLVKVVLRFSNYNIYFFPERPTRPQRGPNQGQSQPNFLPCSTVSLAFILTYTEGSAGSSLKILAFNSEKLDQTHRDPG